MIIDTNARNISIETLYKLKTEQSENITVVIPALNEEKTIGRELEIITQKLMNETPLVDELIVMDGNSLDDTVSIAESFGAKVHSASDKTGGEYPQGKGTAMWRSLFYVTGSIVIFVDADIENFDTHFITAQIAPFLNYRNTEFVKAYYDRPIHSGNTLQSSGGGRVTELLIRPLFSRFFPQAARFIQPLAGEYAFRTAVIKKLVMYSGYGVETSLNLDYIRKFGSNNIVQVDLGVRVHRNQPLADLSKMSANILQTFVDFAEEEGILSSEQHGDDLLRYYDHREYRELGLTQERLPIHNEVTNANSGYFKP